MPWTAPTPSRSTSGRGCRGPRLRGALHPHLPRRLRRDAAPLPATAAGGALDVPAARDRPSVTTSASTSASPAWGPSAGVPGDRRRNALGLPHGAPADHRAQLRPDGDQRPRSPRAWRRIEQFRRSRRRGRSLRRSSHKSQGGNHQWLTRRSRQAHRGHRGVDGRRACRDAGARQEMKAARRQEGGRRSGVLAKIAEMPAADRALAERIHALVKANAPDLTPRT